MTKLAQQFEDVWNAHVEDDTVWSPDGARRHHRFTPDGPVIPPSTPPQPAEAGGVPLRRRPHSLLAMAVALMLVAGVAGAGIAASRRTATERPTLAAEPATLPAIPTTPSAPAVTPSTPAPVATEGRRGVVEITTALAFGSGSGAGTGMLIKPTGDVLTNNHVIEGTSSINVQINGTGRVYKATVVGTDATHDIALLRLDGASDLTTIETADSSTLKVGDPVTAIGNALGQPGPPTVATGAVTALDQSITAGDRGGEGEALAGLIQTDIPLQPGDSGGPLLNSSNQVVGINTAASVGRRAVRTGNEAYAIPIEQALAIVGEIAAGHSSSTIQIGPPAFLGVGLVDAGSAAAGATVATVEDGTPAATAGIAPGDTIVSAAGKPVNSAATLRSVLSAQKPGDKIAIGWVGGDDGQRHTATVTLAAGPPR